MYPWLLYGHLVGVGLLVVGMGINIASIERVRPATSTPQLRDLLAMARLGIRVLIAGGAALLVFGISLAVGYWSLAEGWIVAALALVAFQGLLGAAVSEPRMKRLELALVTSAGAPVGDEQVRGDLAALRAAGRASIAALLELELLMTVKPYGQMLAWSLVATALVAAALASTAYRARPHPAVP